MERGVLCRWVSAAALNPVGLKSCLEQKTLENGTADGLAYIKAV